MVKDTGSQPRVKRKREKILGDSSRVITRLHLPDDPQRIEKIIQRVLDLPDTTAETLLAQVMFDFSNRHEDINVVFNRHLNRVKDYIAEDTVLSETTKNTWPVRKLPWLKKSSDASPLVKILE